MKVYVFACIGNMATKGFSIDKTGAILPSPICPKGWNFSYEIEIEENGENEKPSNHAPTSKEILTGIKEIGYYIYNPAV